MNKETRLFIHTALAVGVVHVSFLALCMYSSEDQMLLPNPNRRIVVKTVALNPTKAPSASKVTTVVPQKIPSEPKKKPLAKKKAPTISNKKELPKEIPKETSKETSKLQEVKKALTALRAEKSTPILQDLKNVSVWNDEGGVEEDSYENILTEMLAQQLRLPEPGDVKIALTLTKTGQVSKLQVLESRNERNRETVEKLVKQMRFPPFGKNMSGNNEKIFTILVKGKSNS